MVFGLGSQLRPCLRVSAFIICLMVVSMFYILNFGNSSNLLHQVVIVAAEKNSSLSMSKDGYLVWTPSCQIPEIDPYDPSIKKMLRRSDPIICSKHGPLTYVTTRDNSTSSYSLMIDSGMISKYVPPHQKLFCCYSIVTRVTVSTENYNSSADNLYSISKCVNFDEEVVLEPNEEFILVKCHSKKTSKSSKQKEVYNNMHAVVQIKESIISKLEENKKCEPCKDKDSRKLNVILVGLDSMSRSSLIRTMPNTVSHLRNNGWTELKGYNKIGDNTFPNLMAILTGYSVKELEHLCWPGRKSKMDDCPFLWKDFSRQGYVTAYVEDEPEMGTFNYHKTGFVKSPTDYYTRPFFLAAEKKLTTKKKDGLTICLGSTSTTDHILKYTTDFTSTFKNNPYFGLFWINNLSHNNINTPASMDFRFLHFFEELYETGAMNSTLIVFFSDHGMRFGKIRQTFIGWLEERLPFIYIWVPESFRKMYPEAYQMLQMNSDRLTSPFDIHMILRDILERNDKNYLANRHNMSSVCSNCVNLFSEVIGDRTCENAGITPHWCTCFQYRPLSVGSTEVTDAAKYILQQIENKLLNAENGTIYKGKCADLSLNRIIKASAKVHPDKKQPDYYDDYLIMFETVPGEAIFESTVRYWHTGAYELMGIVSRINSYASHSKCVTDSELKLYCFCIK